MANKVRLIQRKPHDEVDQETGEAYSDVPGVEHDPVSGAIIEAPAAAVGGLGNMATSGMARMAASKAPVAAAEAAGAEAGGAGILSKIFSKIKMPVKNAGTNLAKQEAKQMQNSSATPQSTREINDSLRTANPTVARQAGQNQDRLGKEGPAFIKELEQKRLNQTDANALSSIGSKTRDQAIPANSNPGPSKPLNYAEMNKMPKKPDSGYVAEYGRNPRVRLKTANE